MEQYDHRTAFLQRVRVAPTFKEVRHILNLATVGKETFDPMKSLSWCVYIAVLGPCDCTNTQTCYI